MQKGPIISLFVCAILVGWLAPTLPTDVAGEAIASEDVDVVEEAGGNNKFGSARSRDSWLAGQTELQRDSDGHFYADIHVDSRGYRFLVDTGASIVALTGRDATDMGLYWDESELRPIGRGASGTVHGVPVTISHMELNGFEANNVQAAIIPDGLDISLLGQSFLSKIDNVAINGDTMKLGS